MRAVRSDMATGFDANKWKEASRQDRRLPGMALERKTSRKDAARRMRGNTKAAAGVLWSARSSGSFRQGDDDFLFGNDDTARLFQGDHECLGIFDEEWIADRNDRGSFPRWDIKDAAVHRLLIT